jgi:hypothetical protein
MIAAVFRYRKSFPDIVFLLKYFRHNLTCFCDIAVEIYFDEILSINLYQMINIVVRFAYLACQLRNVGVMEQVIGF